MPMTPDEVIKIIDKERTECMGLLLQSDTMRREFLSEKVIALSTAITSLQKYEEMNKRVSVEKIEKVYYDNQGNYALTQHQKLICQAIVNYLGGQPDD